MKLAEKLLSEMDKTLVRGKDRLKAKDKSGKDIKIVAVDNGDSISLHLKYADGDLLAKHPKKSSGVDMFDYGLARDGKIKKGSLEIANESIQNEGKELRSHLPKNFVAYTGVKWADQHITQYNKLQDEINSYIKKDQDVPEKLLNSSHKLFSMYSAKY